MRPHRLLVTLALILPAIAGLTACGSSDSTSPTSQAVDTILANVDNLGILELDTLRTTDTSIVFGEYAQGARQWVGWAFGDGGNGTDNDAFRPVISYDLPALAGHGVVDSAKAYVYQCGVNGYNGSVDIDPYASGHVTVDHVNLGRVIPSNASTFMADTLQANIGTISSDSTRGAKSIAVTAQVKEDYSAKRSISQYRLQWTFTTAPTIPPDNPGAAAIYLVLLGSDCAQNGGGPGPWLVIWSH